MNVTLLNYVDLKICSNAIRTCWQSFERGDNGGQKDLELIDRIANQYKHASTLEHLNYTFYIKGISRALLQELARHRHASLSVKSTRYTLKELLKEDLEKMDFKKYLVFTGNDEVDEASKKALLNLIEILRKNTSLDIAKYCLPESYKTELTYTINARSLQNLLFLRTNKRALWEFRELANTLFNTLPKEHQFIFEDFLYKN